MYKCLLVCCIGIIFGLCVSIIFFKSLTKCNTPKINDVIRSMIRQAARWSTASLNDDSSMIAVLHANYGAGYLWALLDNFTTEQIQEATNIDFLKFRTEILNAQDIATKKMAVLCPAYAPPNTYLTSLGGES